MGLGWALRLLPLFTASVCHGAFLHLEERQGKMERERGWGWSCMCLQPLSEKVPCIPLKELIE